MCGIAGFTQYRKDVSDVSGLLDEMGTAIQHRGPDAAGVFVDEQVAMVHRRLSIVDLSESGAQPMHSPSGRYVTVYNGEIYKLIEDQGCYNYMSSNALELVNEQFTWDASNRQLFKLFSSPDKL